MSHPDEGRITIRLDTKSLNAFNHIRETPEWRTFEGKRLSIGNYVSMLIRKAMLYLQIGDLARETVEAVGKIHKIGEGLVINVQISTELRKAAEGATKIRFSTIIRFVLKYETVLRERILLEEKFRQLGVGRPEFYSDEFMGLWLSCRNDKLDETDTKLTRAVGLLGQKLGEAYERIERLETLLEKYAIPGLNIAQHPPFKKDLLAMNQKQLRAVAQRWGIDCRNFSDPMDDILVHFGHKPTGR